ncbi:MAG: hypothetical protein IKM79_00675 [Bacteroidales bacterium]|nr:hypothetical protein [Bacteroidales bacterium]
MNRGKEICNELKAVRRSIAEENGIPLEIKECSYKGECRGTCPRCEAEVQYLERELEKRLRLGKVATVAGITLGLAACGTGTTNQSPNDIWEGEEMTLLQENDSIDTLIPPPPPVEPPDWFLPELEGIVAQDNGYRMVPTRDTMERMKDTLFDWERLYYPNKYSWENTGTANPLDFSEPKVIMRGESGTVVATGYLHYIRRVSVQEPTTLLEKYKENEEWEARKALPKVVEYDEVDGKKVVKQQNPAEQ